MGGRGKNMKKKSVMVEKSPKKNTFEKLKKELFQEAFDLCTLCATQVMIILFSPEGKLYTFGYPNVDSVMQRFLNPSPEDKLYKYGYPDFDGVMRRYLNLKSMSSDVNGAAEPALQRRSVEEIFNNQVLEMIEMVHSGKEKEDMPMAIPEGLSKEEYIEYSGKVDQCLAFVNKTIAEKKKELEASQMTNNNV